MPALNADRNTQQLVGNRRKGPVAAGTVIYAGSIVLRAPDGYLHEGHVASGMVGVGCAEERVNNGMGLAGDESLRYAIGTFQYANSAAADLITFADIGALAFVVDDQTVAKTNGGGTRSPAGVIEEVDAFGVWVRFDEALTKAS